MPRGQPPKVANHLSTATGTYALIFACTKAGPIKVGKLGLLDLRRGYYLYVGSAFGPGGMRARISHHLHPTTSPHWHIDYLKAHCRLRELWVEYSVVKSERRWAKTVSQLTDAYVPLPGFGASDVQTISHLFQFPKRPRAAMLGSEVRPDIITIASGDTWRASAN